MYGLWNLLTRAGGSILYGTVCIDADILLKCKHTLYNELCYSYVIYDSWCLNSYLARPCDCCLPVLEWIGGNVDGKFWKEQWSLAKSSKEPKQIHPSVDRSRGLCHRLKMGLRDIETGNHAIISCTDGIAPRGKRYKWHGWMRSFCASVVTGHDRVTKQLQRQHFRDPIKRTSERGRKEGSFCFWVSEISKYQLAQMDHNRWKRPKKNRKLKPRKTHLVASSCDTNRPLISCLWLAPLKPFLGSPIRCFRTSVGRALSP